jgi:hypothetical protein
MPQSAEAAVPLQDTVYMYAFDLGQHHLQGYAHATREYHLHVSLLSVQQLHRTQALPASAVSHSQVRISNMLMLQSLSPPSTSPPPLPDAAPSLSVASISYTDPVCVSAVESAPSNS